MLTLYYRYAPGNIYLPGLKYKNPRPFCRPGIFINWADHRPSSDLKNQLDLGDVFGSRTFLSLLYLELHPVTLVQGAESN